MSIKKVVIPAAGKGTRMLELSKDRPKHLIHVLDKPFLYYLLSNLKKAGFEEIILVIGYHPQMMHQFAEKYRNEFNLKLVNQFDIIGTDRYGTACPIEAVKKIIGDEQFISVYGDDLYSVGDLKRMNISDEYCYIAGLKVEDPHNYGVLVKDGGDFLEKIIEKPEEFVGNLINIGLYKFTPEIFKALEKVKLSPRGEYELTDAISILAEQKKVKIKMIKDYWLDFGKPEDVEKVAEFLKNNHKL